MDTWTPFPKKEIRSPQRGWGSEGPRNLKFFEPLATRYRNNFFSPCREIFVGGGSTVYTMDNKNANTVYQKVVWVGNQKWVIVETTIGISFFCLRFVLTISYTGSFQVPPEKNHPHLKCQFPPKIPIWPKSLLYKHYEKWLSLPPLPPPPHHPVGSVNYEWHLSLIDISFSRFID